MNKDFMQYVYSRCDKALREDVAYITLARDEKTAPEELQARVEEICYIKGFQDALKLLNNV